MAQQQPQYQQYPAQQQQPGYAQQQQQPAYGQQQQQQPVYAQGQPVVGAVAVPRPLPTPFQTGLCDCTQAGGNCPAIFFCPWCELGYQYNEMVSPGHNPKQMNWAMCLGSFCGDAWLGIGSCSAAIYLRMEARQRYNIAGDALNDICAGMCCTPCSMCQVYKEMSLRGAWPGGVCAEAPFVLPGQPPMMQGGQQYQPVPQHGNVQQAPPKTV